MNLPRTKLVFSTVPTNTTKDVKLIIPPGNIWHIRRSPDGIYLVDRTKPRGKRDNYILSNFADLTIPTDTPFKIDARDGMFVIPYSRGHFEYSKDGSEYVQLSNAMQFMERGEHKFRSGTLEFSLTLEEVKQRDLFS